MRSVLFALLPASLFAQAALYTCVSNTRDYVVGAKLPASGLFVKDGGWRHVGYNHPLLFGLDYDASAIYLAAGNGLIQASEHGAKWKILTGSDVTELRDVAVDRNAPPGTIYFAYSHGIRVTRDGGLTWKELGGGLHRKFTEALRVDRAKVGVLLAGGEEGIFRSADSGEHWTLAGASGFQISHIEQSPHVACEWLATTQGGGLFGSTDCGKSFENVGGRMGLGNNLYDVAFDPFDAKRIAVAGWGPGVTVSEDRGKTWHPRNGGLPVPQAISIVFDPETKGRLYVSIHDEALYVSNDTGIHWMKDGLDGTAVTRMRFVPK